MNAFDARLSRVSSCADGAEIATEDRQEGREPDVECGQNERSSKVPAAEIHD